MSKKQKKAKPGKLPKRIAGVKIPKDLRKSGDALIATAASPIGREVMMAGLASLAGVVASRIMPHAPTPTSGGNDPEAMGARFAERVVAALRTAAGDAGGSPSQTPRQP